MRGRGCYAIYPLSQCLSASFPASWPTLHLIHISYAYLTEQGINATLCNIDDVFPTPLTRCPTATLCQTPLCVCVCLCGACAVWQTSVSLAAQAVTGRCPSFVTHRIELEVRIFIIFQLYCLPRRRYPPPPHPYSPPHHFSIELRLSLATHDWAQHRSFCGHVACGY